MAASLPEVDEEALLRELIALLQPSPAVAVAATENAPAQPVAQQPRPRAAPVRPFDARVQEVLQRLQVLEGGDGGVVGSPSLRGDMGAPANADRRLWSLSPADDHAGPSLDDEHSSPGSVIDGVAPITAGTVGLLLLFYNCVILRGYPHTKTLKLILGNPCSV